MLGNGNRRGLEIVFFSLDPRWIDNFITTVPCWCLVNIYIELSNSQVFLRKSMNRGARAEISKWRYSIGNIDIPTRAKRPSALLQAYSASHPRNKWETEPLITAHRRNLALLSDERKNSSVHVITPNSPSGTCVCCSIRPDLRIGLLSISDSANKKNLRCFLFCYSYTQLRAVVPLCCERFSPR